MGPVALAHLTGIEIIPVVFATDRQWLLKSWDKTRVPKPFSSAVILWGEPIDLANFYKTKKKQEAVNSATENRQISKKFFEHLRQKIETELNILTQKCDLLISNPDKIRSTPNKR